MSTYENLTDSELRKKLLDFGYDLPISINRDFLLRKLQSVTENANAKKKDGGKTNGERGSRHSTPAGFTISADQDSTTTGPGSPSKAVPAGRAGKGKVRYSSVIPPASTTAASSSSVTLGRLNDHPPPRPTTPPPSAQAPAPPRPRTPSSRARAAPVPPPSQVPKTPVSGSSSGSRAATSSSPYSRRSIHDPPKYADEELTLSEAELSVSVGGSSGEPARTLGGRTGKDERIANYLSYFRGSGRGEELFSRNRGSGTSTAAPLTHYSIRSYSDEESETEEDRGVATPKSSKSWVASPLNWGKRALGTMKEFATPKRRRPSSEDDDSGITLISRPSSSRGVVTNHKNGHARGPPGTLRKTGTYFGSMLRKTKNEGVSGATESSPLFIPQILLIVVVLFFGTVLACYFMKWGNVLRGELIKGPSPVKGKDSDDFPICGQDGVDNMACIEKGLVKRGVHLFKKLKEELVQRAKRKGCGAELKDRISLTEAKTLLYHLTDLKNVEVDDCYRGMLYIIADNPTWGLQIFNEELEGVKGAAGVNALNYNTSWIWAKDVEPSFICVIWTRIYTFLTYFVTTLLGCAGIFCVVKGGLYYYRLRKNEEKEVFELIEQILDILYEHYRQQKDAGGDTFLAVQHIRDELVPPKDRLAKAVLWAKATDYISRNESRIREEIQHISGEKFKVWRWLPSASPVTSRKSLSIGGVVTTANPSPSPAHLPNLNLSSGAASSGGGGDGTGEEWQGQAFEVSDGGPNALPVTPSTCLKIRQMFDVPPGQTKDQMQQKIERSILEKCADARILHIGIDPNSNEGCVYLKCFTKEDARKAYLALHGWWFEGHLLSVKFLREERYLVRFPKAKAAHKIMALHSSVPTRSS